MRPLTLLPTLIFAILFVAWALFAGFFALQVFGFLGQACVTAPCRSSQFAWFMLIFLVPTALIAAAHGLVALGLWRDRRWAAWAAIGLSIIAVAALVWAWSPAMAMFFAPALVAYAMGSVLCLARLSRKDPGPP